MHLHSNYTDAMSSKIPLTGRCKDWMDYFTIHIFIFTPPHRKHNMVTSALICAESVCVCARVREEGYSTLLKQTASIPSILVSKIIHRNLRGPRYNSQRWRTLGKSKGWSFQKL